MRVSATTLSTALAVVATILLAIGGPLLYVRQEIVDPDAFADRVVATLDDDAVRTVVSREIVAGVIERGSADLATARPLLETAVSVAVRAPQFERVLHLAARSANRVLLEGEDRGFVLDLADATSLVRPALESVAPPLARLIPNNISPRLLELRREDSVASAVRLAGRTRLLGILLPALGLLALAASVWLAPNRRAAIVRGAIAVGAACALVVVALRLGRSELLAAVHGNDLISAEEARAAAAGVWDTFAGGLRTIALVTGAAAFAVAGAGASRVTPGGADDRLRRLARPLLARPRSTALELSRALAGIALGVALISGVRWLVETLALVIGAAVLFVAADELIEAVEPRVLARDRPHGRRERLRGLAIAALAAAVLGGAATAVIVLASADPATERFQRALASNGCNGSRELCDRRLNEVVFPGTHNSMSAADSPGWAFSNQTRTIPRQLRDGIRLFLLDTHYGVRDPDGTVRTDLAAEGTDRNRLRSLLNPRQLRLANRLAGPIGLGSVGGGEPEPYLCHSACELGATPLVPVLRTYREFLERNPGEVLVLLLEPSITPRDTKQAFRDAGLLRYAAALDRGRPLPTLGQLVRAGRRVVVFSERDGGALPWYHDAQAFIQDTRLGARGPAQLSCARRRGHPESPILMLNDWLDVFPPPVSANGRINGAKAIVARARRCAERRGLSVGLIAVDHYDRGADGGVVAAARTLNEERSAGGADAVRAQQERADGGGAAGGG